MKAENIGVSFLLDVEEEKQRGNVEVILILKVDKFIEIFIDQNGYVKVVQGLQNTVLIAIVGLVIGILIGTVIATARVLPKYKVLPRVLNGICSVYVAMFRGTPMVVQLLVFYYVLLPIIGWNITGVQVAMLCVEQPD